MRPFLFIFLIALSFLARPTQIDLAQADYLGNCVHADGSRIYRPDGVVIRYEYRNARLVLVSLHTGEIAQTLEESLDTSNLANLDWSPDCHYLFGTANGDAILWDAVSGGRAATFEQVTPKNPPYWNTGRDNLILETYGGSYLWNFRQSAPLLLDFDGEFCPTRYKYFNWQVEWDNANNLVFVAPNYVSGNAVIAYDQTTAAQIASYDNACLQGPVKFALTPESVIVFTSENESFRSYSKGITVWNRATMAHVSVDANTQSAVLPGQVALSPDGRYLVLARIGTMRVWDLTDLADDVQQRDPIQRYSIEANTRSARFVGETTVETTDFSGATTQWDILTGEQVS